MLIIFLLLSNKSLCLKLLIICIFHGFFFIHLKSRFLFYADFESTLVSEDNGKQNSNESCSKKYEKHATCSYGFKLVCMDDIFRKAS